jgi:hypothetical protein
LKFKYFLILLIALLAAAAGYYYYQQNVSHSRADVWSFVPQDAILVYETEGLPQLWHDVEEQPAVKVIAALPEIQELQQDWKVLDSTASGMLTSFLESRSFHASMHVTGKNSFDFLLYLPARDQDDKQALEKISGSFRNDKRYRYSKRIYHGVEIHEYADPGSDLKFVWLLQNQYLIGSFTPFLLEDVIRGFDAAEDPAYLKQRHPALFQLGHMEGDAGNLYVNGVRLKALLNIFHQDLPTAKAGGYPFSAKLDIAMNEDGLLLNGYATPEEKQETIYLQSLLHEKPQTLDIDHLLPLRTAELQFYGFEQGKDWHRKLDTLGVLPAWQALQQAHPKARDLPGILGARVALAGLQSPGTEVAQQLLFLHAPQPAQAAALLEALAEDFSQASGDTLYQEVYSSYRISQLAYPNFPEAFLGPAFNGFEETFFLQLHNYIVMSNSVQALKSLILDMEGDNTWRKSLQLYGFLEKTNQEMNFGYYVNTDKAWKKILEAAEPGWQKKLEAQGPELRQFRMLAIQLSALDELFYANILLQAILQDRQELERVQLTTRHETTLEAPLISRPMLARNGLDKRQEVLVQDSLYRLHVLDHLGDVRQSDSLGAKLVGEVFQPEAAKNGRLDYLLVSEDALHRYDPEFSKRAGFPVALPQEARAQWANLIDYNGSKMYRILLASQSGDLYLYDLEGHILEGWQPRPLDGALSAAPGHIRIRGKDILYAFQQKGIIHMMNRRGNAYSGFPLNLQDSLLGPVHISPGSDFKNTLFTTVTRGGELLTFNLEGRITHQQQLYKPDGDARFMLVTDQRDHEFLIVRQSRHRLSLLDRQGNMLFEKDYLIAAGVEVQYYNFGVDKELIAITDPQEEFTYLYDAQGNLLNFEPLNSCCPLDILYQEQEGSYLIYKNYQNTLSALKGGK